IAIVHDLAESMVGDITPHDGVTKEDKFAMEKRAMDSIVELLEHSEQAQEMRSLWLEYEQSETREAQFVHDLDKCEMIIQALEYEKSNSKRLDQFFDSTRGVFKHPQIQGLVQELYQRREQYFSQESDGADS
ncbi:hypothetical protein EV182_003222, partial [Spiromyces aspiralis]